MVSFCRIMFSVILGSYFSKSLGTETSGLDNVRILPVPEIRTLRDIASLVLTSFLSTEEVKLNFPTAPEKLDGLFPAGKGKTSIVTGFDRIVFCVVWPKKESLKKMIKDEKMFFIKNKIYEKKLVLRTIYKKK